MSITVVILVPRRVRRRRPARKASALRPAESHLEALLERVHRKHPGRLWTVNELWEQGFVAADDTRRLGYTLSAAMRAGGRVGRFTLHREGQDRSGAIYRAEVVSSAVTCGDSAALPAKNRP